MSDRYSGRDRWIPGLRDGRETGGPQVARCRGAAAGGVEPSSPVRCARRLSPPSPPRLPLRRHRRHHPPSTSRAACRGDLYCACRHLYPAADGSARSSHSPAADFPLLPSCKLPPATSRQLLQVGEKNPKHLVFASTHKTPRLEPQNDTKPQVGSPKWHTCLLVPLFC